MADLQNEVTKQYESISFQIVKSNYKANDGTDSFDLTIDHF